MSLEPSVTYISDLNPLWPTGADPASISDDNHRNIKKALLDCFAGYTGSVQVTGVDGGTVNAYTLTPATSLPAYGTKMLAVFAPTISNTGAATLNISGLGVKSILSVSGGALVLGDLVVGNVYAAFYDGTQFRLSSVTKNYIDQQVFTSTLPAQAGSPTKVLRTDGSSATWDNFRLYNSVRSTNTILGDADGGRCIEYSAGNFTQTFSLTSILGEGWFVRLKNASTTDAIEVEAPAAVTTTSTTSNSISAGTVWTLPTGLAISSTDLVILRRTSDPYNQRILGTVSSYITGTGVLTINPTYRIGSGTFTDWTITTRAATAGIDTRASFVMYPGEVRDFNVRTGAIVSTVIHNYSVIYTTSGYFISPPGYRYAGGLIWGGGGGGSKTGSAGSQTVGGGGGGACLPFTLGFTGMSLVVIGSGGVGASSAGVGNAGGNSSVGTLTSYGGGGGGYATGGTTSGGGGGGVLSAGATGPAAGSGNTNGGLPAIGTPLDGGIGFGGASSVTGSSGRSATYGGGSGGDFSVTGTGGASLYGGGGGSGGGTVGPSVFGGAGGMSNDTTSGTDGSAPAGGAGSTRTGSKGGDGGRGEARIWGII